MRYRSVDMGTAGKHKERARLHAEQIEAAGREEEVLE